MAIRFRPRDTVDFVIVGSGAAGGIVAKELASAGLTVLVLEQGPRRGAREFEHDELKTFILGELSNDPVRHPVTFRKTEADPAVASQSILLYHRLVGGGSVMFSGNYWRCRESDFQERTRSDALASTGLSDWPITYADLEPYYTKAEWALGVSGAPGPFEPPRSRPYPMPPLPVKSSGVLFEQGARALGLHPQPSQMAINSQTYNGRPACQHCGFCLLFMCEFRSKSTSMAVMLPLAEATGRCDIRPGRD